MESYLVALYVILVSLQFLNYVESGNVYWHYSRCVRPFVLLCPLIYYCLFICLWLSCAWANLTDIFALMVSMSCCWLLIYAIMTWACLIFYCDWSYCWGDCSIVYSDIYLCLHSPDLFNEREYWSRLVCEALVGDPPCSAPVVYLGLLILPNINISAFVSNE